MDFLLPYIERIEKAVRALDLNKAPENLYQPYEYMLQLGGKRIRPAIVLMSGEAFGADLDSLEPIALSVEVFHNFSLVHDDLMDDAPLRRGKTTVYKKWNPNIAILSGDVMLVHAYQLIEKAPDKHLAACLRLFNKTAIEVCEGQQYDMDFESMAQVNVADYIEMIRLKTAVLLGASMQMGALLGDASLEQQKLLYSFGENLGLAFQLQDDLLDAYPESDAVGKQIGGDILSNKKTFLLLTALADADKLQKDRLNHYIFNGYNGSADEKLREVLSVFNSLEVKAKTIEMVRHYSDIALKALDTIDLPEAKKEIFRALTSALMMRSY